MSESIAPTTEAPAAPAIAAAPVEPAAPVTPTPEPAAPVVTEITPENASEVIGELSAEARRAILFGEPAPAAKAEPKPPAAPAETPAAPATPQAVEPTPPADPEADPEDSAPLPKNFRIHTEDPMLSTFMRALKTAQRTNPNVNPADVARTVGYDMPPAPASDPSDDVEDVPGLDEPGAPAPGSVEAIQAEITALQAQLDEKSDELISPEYNKLAAQLRGKERDLLKAEIRAEDAAKENRKERMSAREQNKADTLAIFPTANDENSLLGAEITAQFNAITANPNHPDRARMAKDDFPAFLTKKAADAVSTRLQKTLGLTPAQAEAAVKGQPATPEATAPAKPATPANPQTPPVPRTVLVTAPGGRPAPQPVAMDATQILERARTDPNFRRAALGFASNVVIS